MTYTIKEIFYTLQGEGVHTGRPAVFCRFAGCNLWSGRAEDRAHATCQFCDTDFVGTDGSEGGKYASAEDLADKIENIWQQPGHSGISIQHSGKKDFPECRIPNAESWTRFVVCTGGEPLLQLDQTLINALHDRGFAIAVETNGTLTAPEGIDWVCVSPKAGAPLKLTTGDELKVVVPQAGLDPLSFADLPFRHFSVQPMDGPDAPANLRLATEFCLHNPSWRLSLQTHKMIGMR